MTSVATASLDLATIQVIKMVQNKNTSKHQEESKVLHNP